MLGKFIGKDLQYEIIACAYGRDNIIIILAEHIKGASHYITAMFTDNIYQEYEDALSGIKTFAQMRDAWRNFNQRVHPTNESLDSDESGNLENWRKLSGI